MTLTKPTQSDRVLASERPCRHCGKVTRPPYLTTHEPACDPVRREARRVRQLLHAREVRLRPGWRKPPAKRDACPNCGASKLVRSAHCRKCDRGGVRPRPVEQRFWQYVDTSGGVDACWPWTGAHNTFGYGVLNERNHRNIGAHRVSWMAANGPIPDGLHILHHCDNPPCVNPAHLYAGTQSDNTRDAVRRGRHKTPWRKSA